MFENTVKKHIIPLSSLSKSQLGKWQSEQEIKAIVTSLKVFNS